jgi:hypothetical protein
MFDSEPTELSDYLKCKLEDPCIDFAISRRGAKVGLGHVGIQVGDAQELAQMQTRLNALQPSVEMEEGTTCRYAKSDKYWVRDPLGIAWETFHTLESIPVFGVPAKQSQRIPIAIPVWFAKSEVASSCCAPSASSTEKSSCC